MKKLNFTKLKCLIFGHNWTSHVNEGIKPTDDQILTEEGFWEYAKMYCGDCGHESSLNLKADTNEGK